MCIRDSFPTPSLPVKKRNGVSQLVQSSAGIPGRTSAVGCVAAVMAVLFFGASASRVGRVRSSSTRYCPFIGGPQAGSRSARRSGEKNAESIAAMSARAARSTE